MIRPFLFTAKRMTSSRVPFVTTNHVLPDLNPNPFAKLLFFGIPKTRFQHAKHRHNISGLVQIHHIVPRQFRNHPIVVSCAFYNFHIDDGCNLMLLPNKRGRERLSTARPCHDGGHVAYNRFVGKRLSEMQRQRKHRVEQDATRDAEDLVTLIQDLRHEVRTREYQLRSTPFQIPWL